LRGTASANIGGGKLVSKFHQITPTTIYKIDLKYSYTSVYNEFIDYTFIQVLTHVDGIVVIH
jgi:hypothetical protein